MIGQPVQATLWEVHYRHLSADDERDDPDEPHVKVRITNPFVAQIAAQAAAERAVPSQFVNGRCFVLTADPTGSDLYAVVSRAVLGAGEPSHDFSIMQATRVCDAVKGSAVLEGGFLRVGH